MPRDNDGQALREWFLKYIASTTDTIAGMPASAWVDRPLEQYCRDMQHADGSDEQAWGGGGFAEACTIANALQSEASVLVLHMRDDGAHALAWSNPSIRDPLRIVCLAWFGRHWQRARLRGRAWEALFNAWPP